MTMFSSLAEMSDNSLRVLAQTPSSGKSQRTVYQKEAEAEGKHLSDWRLAVRKLEEFEWICRIVYQRCKHEIVIIRYDYLHLLSTQETKGDYSSGKYGHSDTDSNNIGVPVILNVFLLIQDLAGRHSSHGEVGSLGNSFS